MWRAWVPGGAERLEDGGEGDDGEAVVAVVGESVEELRRNLLEREGANLLDPALEVGLARCQPTLEGFRQGPIGLAQEGEGLPCGGEEGSSRMGRFRTLVEELTPVLKTTPSVEA